MISLCGDQRITRRPPFVYHNQRFPRAISFLSNCLTVSSSRLLRHKSVFGDIVAVAVVVVVVFVNNVQCRVQCTNTEVTGHSPFRKGWWWLRFNEHHRGHHQHHADKAISGSAVDAVAAVDVAVTAHITCFDDRR